MSDQRVGTQSQVIEVGDVVSERYEIKKKLGAGGFAKVYLAHDRVIERDVAIKFLDLRNMHGADSLLENVLERFRREAKLAAKIPHRNVVQIYDIGMVGEDVGRPFIVMELLNGFDLEDQLNEHGPMEPSRLLPLYIDCLDALGEAHEMGIVHKDLKPSNLFLSSPGHRSEALRIVDFGIAHIKSVEEEQKDVPETERTNRLTATGQILGTLQYLTPEYIGQQIVTPALDVYQMTLILIEILSGERVIKTDNPFECLRIHTFGLLEVPEYLMSSSLGPVLSKGLEADHTQRYADAKELADALSDIDPASVPRSPMMDGEEVATAKFVETASSPVIPNAPATDEFVTGDTIGLDVASNPEQSSAPDAASDSFSKLEAVGRGDTREQAPPPEDPQADRSTAATARGERERQTSAGPLPALPEQNTGIPSSLKIALGVVALGVIGALVAVVVIIAQSGEEGVEPEVEEPVIAAVEKAEPEQPDVPQVEPEEVVADKAETVAPEVVPEKEKPRRAPKRKARSKVEEPPEVDEQPEVADTTPKTDPVEEKPPVDELVETPPEPDPVKPEETLAAAVPDVKEDPPPVVEQPEPFKRTVTVVTNTKKAKITVLSSGKSYSEPHRLEFESEDAPGVKIRIEADGYDPVTKTVKLPSSKRVKKTYKLQKKRMKTL